MPNYVGGLRARLVRDSIYNAVHVALGDLGWFTDRASRSPVTFIPEVVAFDQEVPMNTVALSDESDRTDYVEMGSQLSELSWGMILDVYPENDSLGLHLIRDIKDILEGRMPSIGRGRPFIDVYDYTLATPVVIFSVEIENVKTDKAHNFPQPWMRFWRSCNFTVVDSYTDEDTVEPFDELSGGYGGGY